MEGQPKHSWLPLLAVLSRSTHPVLTQVGLCNIEMQSCYPISITIALFLSLVLLKCGRPPAPSYAHAPQCSAGARSQGDKRYRSGELTLQVLGAAHSFFMPEHGCGCHQVPRTGWPACW